MKNVFVVTANGYFLNCGSEIYLIGVFDNYEDARTASLHCGADASITIIELNQAFPLKRADEASRDYEKSNDYFLGGYCE